MDDQDRGLLSLAAQVRGGYLAETKVLARESYLRREIGTEEDFEQMWQQAFMVEEPTDER